MKLGGLMSAARAWAIGLIAFASAVAANEPAASPRSAVEVAAEVDKLVDARLAKETVPASPLADDSEFLRRVYLEIAGVIPPLDEVHAFLDDTATDKRARLIDKLLASPEYTRHMSDQWRELLIPTTAAAARRAADRGLRRGVRLGAPRP